MRPNKSSGFLLGLLLAGSLHAPLPAGEVLLQYFEGQWTTIERRMPDVFMAGYDGIWVPPPSVADSGGFSVGYDVFDRFNLGAPNWRTLYGTTQDFVRLSDEMDRAGMDLYVDVILNHNGFRDASSPGFVEGGDYPGFVTTLPNDVDGDFHGAFEGGELTFRLAGLIDIAQEKNYLFTRHPVPGAENNIPNETPRESNRALYPDRDLPAEFGRHPFNLADPMAGDPIQENATGLLLRYLQWLVEVHGVDGFRIDAARHIPTFFFNDFYDAAVYNLGRNPIDGSPFTPFSFSEIFTGDFNAQNAYFRKDGFGNRDVLDFPLFFAMDSVFGAGGFGDMRALEFASYDAADGNANDGTRGVLFAGSHDSFGAGSFSGLNNVAQAHILTRTGLPVVYYNPMEFGEGRDFPKGGRGDALGNFANILPPLVHLNGTHIRGAHATRWIDADIYIYERVGNALIGLSDRRDAGYDERNVQTAFAPGTVLTELTGNATDAFVDPNADIFDTVTVDGDGRVTLRVPRNTAAVTNDDHGRGYVVYGPAAPPSTLVIENAAGVIPPDPEGTFEPQRRLTPLTIVTADTIDVRLDVAASPAVPNDNALIKVNFGALDVDGDGSRQATGEFAGFESFTSVTGEATEPRVYTAALDATLLPEGYNYLETVAFLQRPGGSDPLFDAQRLVVYLDRLPPAQDLLFPPQTGEADITSTSYEAVVSVDPTANAVHVLRDLPAGLDDAEILALVGPGNQARRHDRLEFRRVLDGLTDGTTELTVVAFEETGNYSIVRYGGIAIDIPDPQILLGIDTDPDPGTTDFQPVPAEIATPILAEDIVIRVAQTADGSPISFPEDFTVSLSIDGEEPFVAQPFDAALLPPVGRLVQNDQTFGDGFDEFRFQWRGYTRGAHTLRAEAQLTEGGFPPNAAIAEVFVREDTPGPSVTITTPAPPSQPLVSPDMLTVAGTFDDNAAAFARVFLDDGENSIPLGTIDDPTSGPFSLTVPVDSYALRDVIDAGALSLTDGIFPVRVIASTGPNGEGIATEASSAWDVSGLAELPTRPRLAADGNAADTLAEGVVLAASAADGPNGEGTPADFGADGTLTELRARLQDDVLFLALRGDFFGADETNFSNTSLVLLDLAAGSGNGATDVLADLQDFSDGLRGEISRAAFSLAPAVANSGVAFDVVVGLGAPEIAFGYTLGTDGTEGTFTEFAFQPNIFAAYDGAAAGDAPAALGASYAAPNAFEIALNLDALGRPDPAALRFAATTANAESGYASPNTLPENSGDAFGESPNPQLLEAVAALPETAPVLVNEVFLGTTDWIELHNPAVAPVDLGGWTLLLYDSAGVRADYVFPPATVVPAGGYTWVSDEGGPTPPATPLAPLVAGFNFPWDPIRGGAIGLVDPAGVGRDYVGWRNIEDDPASEAGRVPYGTAWSGAAVAPDSNPPATGQSLARDAVSTDTDDAADWDRTSGANAFAPTPGAVNASNSSLDAWYLF